MDEPTQKPHDMLSDILPPQTTYDNINSAFYGTEAETFSTDSELNVPTKRLSRKERKKLLYKDSEGSGKEDKAWKRYNFPRTKNPTTYEEHSNWVDYKAKPPTITNIVTRESWGAVEPLSQDLVEGHPLSKVLALYTGMDPCFTREECCREMRKLQKHYMEEWKLTDIPWNFLIGCDGRVYEGRGWGVHAKKVNSLYKYRQLERKSYDIAYIGPYFKGRQMPSAINIVTRAEWKARPPHFINKLQTPVDTVLLMYTGSGDNMTEKEVLSILPEMQLANMGTERRPDIIYNWLVDYNGNIYEGRGWRANVEKDNFSPYGKFDGKSLDIGMIGNFADKNPPRFMEKVVTQLIEWGMTEKFIINTRHLKIYNWKDFPNEYTPPNSYVRRVY